MARYAAVETFLTCEQSIVWDWARTLMRSRDAGGERKQKEMSTKKALRVFVSYSHKDAKLKDRMLEHLAQLRHDDLISVWHDRELLAADDWDETILAELRSSDLILFLVSSAFTDSRYCYEKELRIAVEMHEAGQAKAVPVILRPCDWQSSPLGKLVALPQYGRPVTSRRWKTYDEAFQNVVKELRRLVESLRAST
jgi:hypothetical protein